MRNPVWDNDKIMLADAVVLEVRSGFLATARCDAIQMPDAFLGSRDEREARLFALRAFLQHGEAFVERLRDAIDAAAALEAQASGRMIGIPVGTVVRSRSTVRMGIESTYPAKFAGLGVVESEVRDEYGAVLCVKVRWRESRWQLAHWIEELEIVEVEPDATRSA